MTAARSMFSRTNRAFENAKLSCLKRHEIDFFPVAQVMQISSQLFQMLDRADPVQAEVSRRLWVLRSSILFTVLPFDDPALRLQNQMSELEQSATSRPRCASIAEMLNQLRRPLR